MIVVTGAAGFIGSNLVCALNERGRNDVIIVDWLGQEEKWRNLVGLRFSDLIFPERLEEFLSRHAMEIEIVFHLGADSSTTARDGDAILRTNLMPSMMLWRWCAKNGKPFIYASSAATYGDGSAGFDDQVELSGLTRLTPLNLYGWSKHAFDVWALQQVESGNAPPRWAGLKFFNVYGPRERHKGDMMSLVSKLYPQLRQGTRIRLFKSHRPDYEDGKQLRDFVYVSDCVNVMLWMMEKSDLAGIFNLGTGTARSFYDLVGSLASAMGLNADIEYVDMPESIRSKYQYFTRADMRKLRAAGYNQDFSTLETGVRDCVKKLAAND